MQTVRDYKKAKDDKNFTEFVKVVEDVDDLFKTLKPALQTCAPIPAEAKFDWEIIKKFHSIKGLVHHMEQNIVGDSKEMVLPNLRKAEVSCKAQDWMTCGTSLGEALHVLFLAPYPDEKKTELTQMTKVPKWLDIDFTVNFLDFLLDDTHDVLLCIFGLLMPVADVLDAKKELSLHKFKKFEGDVHLLFETDLPSAMEKCDVPSADAKAVLEMLSGVKSVGDFIKQMKKNWGNDPNGLILNDLEAALQAAVLKQHDLLGQHLGSLVHRLIVNTTYPDEQGITV